MRTKDIKAAVMNRTGVEKVRIRKGEIHAYGQLPNSNVDGWWFVAYVFDVQIKGIDALYC